MSGKYKKKRPNQKKKIKLLLVLLVCAAALVAALLMFGKTSGSDPVTETAAQDPIQTEPGSTAAAADQQPVMNIHDLGSGVEITDFLSYTGAFMEDRTDEVVSDVLAIKVTNSGEEYIQTMDITLTAGETRAEFSLSTLFPGETVVVLEKNRMSYSSAPDFRQVQTSAVALFAEHPGMCQDKLEIQCLNGVINVTNISGEDLTGDILVYYKNYVDGLYFGGITYRLRIQGGLKAGEIRQGTAAHFNPDNSTVVFVTCG